MKSGESNFALCIIFQKKSYNPIVTLLESDSKWSEAILKMFLYLVLFFALCGISLLYAMFPIGNSADERVCTF